jgi:hypothetical protein
MIHLFNNVFLEQDIFINQLNKNIVISETYNTQDISASSNALLVSATLEDALDGRSIGEFLKSLMIYGNEKIMIYADNTTFAALAASWLKSSTNMDQEALDVFADCYKYKLQVFRKRNDQVVEFLKTVWDTAPVFDFTTDDFMPSFEFCLASGFANRDFNKKEKLKALLSKFIKREYEDLILEARKHLDTYILDQDLQQLLGGSGKTLQNFRELPRMSIYREPFFKDSLDNMPNLNPYQPGENGKLNISRATDEELAELCQLTDDINMAIMRSAEPSGLSGAVSIQLTPSWVYASSVKSGLLTDAEYNSVLDEILAEPIAMPRVPFDLRDQIVFVFLPYIKTLKKSNNTSMLEKFTLR